MKIRLSFALFCICSILSAAPPPELTVLRQQYEKAVTAPHEAAVSDLNAKFTTALGNAATASKQAGKLEEVLAIQEDQKRLADKLPLPDDDEKTPEGLKKLRAIYRDQLSKLEAQRSANHTALLPAYTAKLKDLEANLTKVDRIEEAKEVMLYRGTVESGAALSPMVAEVTTAPPSTTPATPAGTTAKVEPKRDHRPAIEWVLSVGGSVWIADGSGRKLLKPGGSIPKGKLVLKGVEFTNYTGQVNARFDDSQLDLLAGIETLDRVLINKVPVSASNMRFLSSCPGVTDLILHGVKMNAAELAPHVARLGNLRSLDINDGPIGIELLRAVATLKLEELHLQTATSTDEIFEPISGMTSLKELSLALMGEVTDDVVRYFLPLKQLTKINFINTHISEDAICQLGSPRIINLGWGSSVAVVTASTYAKLAKAFPAVQNLALPRDRSISEEEMQWIAANMTEVKKIGMAYGKPQPGCFKAIASFPKLDTLDLWKCNFSDDQLAELSACKKLRWLAIPDTKAGDAALEHLRSVKSLKDINVGGTTITDGAKAAFKKARPDVRLY